MQIVLVYRQPFRRILLLNLYLDYV